MGCKFFLVRSIGSAATDYSGSIFPRNGLFICLSGDFKLNARPRGDGLAFCVVGCRIERTKKKYEFCTLLTVLLRSRRGHGAKVSKRIEKNRIFGVSEVWKFTKFTISPGIVKSAQNPAIGGRAPPRSTLAVPARFEIPRFVRINTWNFDFVKFRGFGIHHFARSSQTSSEIRDLKVGMTQTGPCGSNGPLKSEIRTY